MLVSSHPSVGQRRAWVAKMANGILACVRNSVASGTRAVVVPSW